jgi:hypothetical protein
MARDRISLTVIGKIVAANAARDRERELDGDTKSGWQDGAVALSPS